MEADLKLSSVLWQAQPTTLSDQPLRPLLGNIQLRSGTETELVMVRRREIAKQNWSDRKKKFERCHDFKRKRMSRETTSIAAADLAKARVCEEAISRFDMHIQFVAEAHNSA